MTKNMILDALNELNENKRKKSMRIYQDENGEIKEEPLTSKDMSASALTHKNKRVNQAKEIHKFIFGS